MAQQLSTNTFGCAKWIVDPTLSNGTHSTIQAAINSASSGDTVFIRPGTYTEDITLKAGVNVTAYNCDSYTPNVTILGNVTASYNGTVSISGINLRTNGAACLTVSGSSSSTLNLINCAVNANNATAISVNAASFAVNFLTCNFSNASNNLIFAITTTTGVDFRNCTIVSGTGASTIAAGAVNFFNSKCQIFSVTTSSTGTFNAYNSFFDNSTANQTVFTTAGTGSSQIFNSTLYSGTASAVSVGSGTTLNIITSNINSSNTNPITGLGTVNLAPTVFSNTGFGINTSTISEYNFGRAGTYTPSLTFGGGSTGITYTSQTGSYLKIGKLCIFQCIVNLSSKGSSTGIAQITLPFTAATFSGGRYMCPGEYTSLTYPASCTYVLGEIASGGTVFTLVGQGSATVTNCDDTNFVNTTIIRINGAYLTA